MAQRARAQWRAVAAAEDREAWSAWRAQQGLADVARACMHRGDLVRVGVAGHAVVGRVVDVADDLVALARASGCRVDVHTGGGAPWTLEVLRDGTHGRARGLGLGGLRGALLERSAAHRPALVVLSPSGVAWRGGLGAGADHLWIEPVDGGGGLRHASLAAVALIADAADSLPSVVAGI